MPDYNLLHVTIYIHLVFPAHFLPEAHCTVYPNDKLLTWFLRGRMPHEIRKCRPRTEQANVDTSMQNAINIYSVAQYIISLKRKTVQVHRKFVRCSFINSWAATWPPPRWEILFSRLWHLENWFSAACLPNFIRLFFCSLQALNIVRHSPSGAHSFASGLQCSSQKGSSQHKNLARTRIQNSKLDFIAEIWRI